MGTVGGSIKPAQCVPFAVQQSFRISTSAHNRGGDILRLLPPVPHRNLPACPGAAIGRGTTGTTRISLLPPAFPPRSTTDAGRSRLCAYGPDGNTSNKREAGRSRGLLRLRDKQSAARESQTPRRRWADKTVYKKSSEKKQQTVRCGRHRPPRRTRTRVPIAQ